MQALDGRTVIPGDLLAANTTSALGSTGTHAFGPSVSLLASVAGRASVSKAAAKQSISVLSTAASGVPAIGQVVFGRVTRANPRQATIDILATGLHGSHVLSEPFQALIRQQDIRATEIDKVKVSESFRVGDIVRGLVISLGDERNYYVSTAKNEYGVILAKSESGQNQMVPVSWREMKDMAMGVNEPRKVAKVI